MRKLFLDPPQKYRHLFATFKIVHRDSVEN